MTACVSVHSYPDAQLPPEPPFVPKLMHPQHCVGVLARPPPTPPHVCTQLLMASSNTQQPHAGIALIFAKLDLLQLSQGDQEVLPGKEYATCTDPYT